MHFWHPRTITTFKNQNYLKIWGFQAVPYTRVVPFGLIFGLKFQNSIRKCTRNDEKVKKKLEIFQKYCNFPQNAFWASRNHHKLQKPKVLQNLGFSGIPIHQSRPSWAHFWHKKFNILAENDQGVMKKWKNFRNFSKIFQTFPECILGILESSQPSKTEISSKFEFFRVSHTPD